MDAHNHEMELYMADIVEEHHELYARFIAIPVQVLELLENGTISSGDALLLGLLDGFCNHSQGKQCYASNQYLAKRMGVSVKRIEGCLCQLRKLDLIESNGGGRHSKRGLRVKYPNLDPRM